MSGKFTIAKERIIDDLEGILSELFDARPKDRKGSSWFVVNPFRPGAKASQMAVRIKGGARGQFIDFVSGDKGDAIQLVAYGLEGSTSREAQAHAVEWAFDRYGLGAIDAQQRERIAAEARARRSAAEAQAERDLEAARTRARKTFFSAHEGIRGTPVETYLESRGIRLADLPALPPAFRYMPRAEYWMDEARPRFPALISAMVDGSGRLGACHWTFLRPDGTGKAEVEKAKLMYPATNGLVIRIANGASGLSPEKAAEAKQAGLCALLEGIEDGLSLAMERPDLRIWAAGSLPGLLTVPDHDAVSGWIGFKDNDWGKPQAAALYERAMRRLRLTRKPVETVSMPADWGKDINDAINSQH